MKRNTVRWMFTMLLTAAGLVASPITGVTLADPPMLSPRETVTLDLGNGLIWEGPEVTPDEWEARMLGVPPAAGFGMGMEQLTTPQAPTPTPEPSSLLMLPAGIAAGIWRRRRR